MLKKISAVLLATLIPTLTQAAAYQLYETGTPLNGTAAVGQAAVASDASTAFYNPAGMAILPGSELMLGAQTMVPNIHFSKGAATTIRGDNGGNAAILTPGMAHWHRFAVGYHPKCASGCNL